RRTGRPASHRGPGRHHDRGPRCAGAPAAAAPQPGGCAVSALLVRPPTASPRDTLARTRSAPARRRRLLLAGLSLALLAVLLVRLLLGEFTISLLDALRILRGEEIPA